MSYTIVRAVRALCVLEPRAGADKRPAPEFEVFGDVPPAHRVQFLERPAQALCLVEQLVELRLVPRMKRRLLALEPSQHGQLIESSLGQALAEGRLVAEEWGVERPGVEAAAEDCLSANGIHLRPLLGWLAGRQAERLHPLARGGSARRNGCRFSTPSGSMRRPVLIPVGRLLVEWRKDLGHQLGAELLPEHAGEVLRVLGWLLLECAFARALARFAEPR